MRRISHLALRSSPVLLLLGLTLLANSSQSQSPSGAVQLFVLSLISALGFLLFASQQLRCDKGGNPRANPPSHISA